MLNDIFCHQCSDTLILESGLMFVAKRSKGFDQHNLCGRWHSWDIPPLAVRRVIKLGIVPREVIPDVKRQSATQIVDYIACRRPDVQSDFVAPCIFRITSEKTKSPFGRMAFPGKQKGLQSGDRSP